MATHTPLLYSITARKKIGLPNGFGETRFGWSRFGDWFEMAGIYQGTKAFQPKTYKKNRFWDFRVPSTAGELASQSKFANAVSAWQALGTSQKLKYNTRAIGRHMSGYNLFIKEYMKLQY